MHSAAGQVSDCCCRFWPVRHYAWGSVSTLAPNVSDLLLLTTLLLEPGFEPLKQATEERYHRFRQAC